MVGVHELRRLNPVAWTGLLAKEIDQETIVVTAVEREPYGNETNTYRYILSLDGYLEPISFLGKETNREEAQFYRRIASDLPAIAPKCWLAHVEENKNWIVLQEPFNNYIPELWSTDDIEKIIGQMVQLHVSYWQKESELRQYGFRQLLGQDDPSLQKKSEENPDEAPERSDLQPVSYQHRIGNWQWGDQGLLSEHAILNAGNILPELIVASESLERIIARGGWPGVFEESHWQAAAELLDDPLPMLYPLRQLPETFINGAISPESWHLDLFGSIELTNWRQSKIGPSVYDLVTFIEQIELKRENDGSFNTRESWPVSEETMVDSYILSMGKHLGSRFSPAASRHSIPAASCLFILTTCLPRLADLLDEQAGESASRQRLIADSQDEEESTGNSLEVKSSPYWINQFQRFLYNYRIL
jgi:hypothetical protein